jgi:regulator of replication initiation timing
VNDWYTTLRLVEETTQVQIENMRLRRLLEQVESNVREWPSDLWTSEMQPVMSKINSAGEQRGPL